MKQKIFAAIFLLSCFSVHAQNPVSSNAAERNSEGLSFTIRADKERYALGETITVTLTWRNVSEKDFEIMTTTMMDAVSVYDESAGKDLSYQGIIACGSGGVLKIKAGEKFEFKNILNNFRFPSFNLNKPGGYTVKASYASANFEKRPNFWTGNLNASNAFQIVRLDDAALDAQREKALAGDKRALQIVAAHGDETIVSSLAELLKSSDKEIRQTVYQTLLVINTDTSIRLLAEAATTKIPADERLNILRSLDGMKPAPNAVVIPSMEKLLTDEYVGGYATSNKEGEPPRRYKMYTVRKWAYFILRKLGVEANVVYEEEVNEAQK